tara:strand:- start:301 stop:588 length:288 start_codon:yes stop_codon:yes gene_type:complete
MFPGFKEPTTSMEAAEAIAPAKGSLQRLVLDYLNHMGHHGATCNECAAYHREDILNIRPRFTELEALGLITKTTRTRKNPNGKNVRVWALAALTD